MAQLFDDILEDIESVFAGTVWKAAKVPTFPNNYQGKMAGIKEYAILNVLPSSSQHHSFGAGKQIDGLVAVKMFVPAGHGQLRLMAIADVLDTVLDSKTLPNNTKLGTSYLSVEGLDSSNSSLYSATYFIPFKSYGE